MLYHVAYVEEGGVRAGEVVRGADAEGGVLHGHVETAEGHHFAAVREVEVVEGGLLEDFITGCGGRVARCLCDGGGCEGSWAWSEEGRFGGC